MAVTIKSSGPRGAKTYEVRVDGQLYHYTDTLADARESAKQARAEQRTESGDYVRTKTGWRRVGPRSLWTNSARKNPTKAQKREKTRKASAKRRVAVALASYLKKVNPAVKLAGARVEKLKGGVLKITPIKANAGSKGKGPYYVGNYGPISTLKEAKAIAAMLRRQGQKGARVNTW